MIRHLKAMWQYSKYQAWIDCPEWHNEDAIALKLFLKSRAGARLKATLLNGVIRQQASALVSENSVDRQIGYANGFRGCVSFIESLTEVSDSEAE